MSVVEIELYSGTGQPAVGSVTWRTTSRVDYQDGILLPSPIKVPLYDGKASLEIPPSPEDAEPAWAWLVTEDIKGGGGTTRLVTVPDSETALSYRDDLIDLTDEQLGGGSA